MKHLKFSEIEINHLFIAWLFISLAFAIAQTGFSDFTKLGHAIIFSAITVGLGFLLHEISHKYLAQKYGVFAEFRADFVMLLVAVFFSFTGFIFAAPGAVIIIGHLSQEKNGKISAAGPLMNFILAALFLLAYLYGAGWVKELSLYGVLINSWLGIFNMIPFGPFDGKKIFDWSKVAYFSLLALGIILMFANAAITIKAGA